LAVARGLGRLEHVAQLARAPLERARDLRVRVEVADDRLADLAGGEGALVDRLRDEQADRLLALDGSSPSSQRRTVLLPPPDSHTSAVMPACFAV
jgi:hypothetical protein